MTQSEIDAYLRVGAESGKTFDEVMTSMRGTGAAIPMTMESSLRSVFDGFGGKKASYEVGANVAATPDPTAGYGEAQNPYKDFTLDPSANKLTGTADFMSMQGAFGGTGYTGWAMPALSAVNAVSKTVLGYKQLAAEEESNKKKLAFMEEANNMKKLKMKNQVNQANRYAMLATGNSNSQTATMGAINKTPYTSIGLS